MTSRHSKTLVFLRSMENSEGCDLLQEAWYAGKNSDQKKTRLFEPEINGPRYVLAQVPLCLVRPNEAGNLYDGTANAERVNFYATQKIDTPVYLLFGPRAVRLGSQFANVMDGGHRVSAARLRGDSTILSLMKENHFELLSFHAEKVENKERLDRSEKARTAAGKINATSSFEP